MPGGNAPSRSSNGYDAKVVLRVTRRLNSDPVAKAKSAGCYQRCQFPDSKT